MKSFKETEPLQQLIDSLQRLPSIGQRTARRLAYHLLQYDREGAQQIASSIRYALEHLTHCRQCNSFSVEPICPICADPQRHRTQLCIVEMPTDLTMIEATHTYHGLYYVLMGKLQPIAGVGADELGFDKLFARIAQDPIEEVILATNYTTEGETTAYQLSELLQQKGIKVSRIARGVPSGSELEYVDVATLAWAFMERR